MKKFPTNGFTLIELLVAVSILSLIMAYAVPGLTEMVERGQMRADLAKFKSSLQMARSEAVTRRAAVVMCGSTNGTACRSNGRRQFGDGWIVFVDRNNNSVADLGSGHCGNNEDCMLTVERVSSHLITIRSEFYEIGFNSDGTPDRTDGYEIMVCADSAQSSGDNARSTTINITPTGSFNTNKGTRRC